MEFSRQEYWSELPLPSPGHLPDPGIEPGSPALQADSLLSEPQESVGFPGGSVVKNSPVMQESWVRTLDREDPLEEEMATHSNILAWRIL